jgi:bacterioferritin-associated ferredoxin
MYVCLCKGITEADIREFGRAGIVEPDALAAALGVDKKGCCGRCVRDIEELVSLAASETNLISLAARS